MADHKAQARQFTDTLQSNPEWQKYWDEQIATMRRGQAAGTSIDQDKIRAYYQPQWAAAAKRITGMDVPHDYEFNMVGSLSGRPDELVTRRGFMARNPWVMPAAAATAGIAAPLVGGFAGGGAAATGAGGATPALSSIPTSAGFTMPTVGGVSSLAAPAAATTGAGGGMGVGGVLKNIFGFGGGGGGGGGADLARRALSIGGDIASNIAAGRTKGRIDEADYNLDRDRQAQLRAQLEQQASQFGANLDLDRRKFAEDSDRAKLKRAVALGMLGGMQDVSIDVPDELKQYVPKISGGATPSSIANRAALVEAMQPRVLKSLMEGEKFDPYKPPPIPELSAIPSRTGLDKGLDIVGYAGLANDILGRYFPRGTTPQQPTQTSSNPAPVNTRGLRFG